MDKIELVHYTNISNLPKILEIGKILDQRDRVKYSNIKEGEGSFERKLCDPTIEKVDIDKCDEAYGVFFRVHVKNTKFILPRRNQVAIVFKGEILRNKSWHLNYCENNGFLVRDNYVPFGNEDATCPDSCNKIKDINLSSIDPKDSEIIIYKSVSINNNNLLKIVNNKNEEVVDVISIHKSSVSPKKSKIIDNSVSVYTNSKSKFQRKSLNKKYFSATSLKKNSKTKTKKRKTV
jgi:hypothetical protein